MADITMRVNDTLPAINAILKDANGPFDLTNFTLRFVMRSSDNDIKADGSTDSGVTIIGATSGAVRFNWSTSEVDVAGNFLGEFEATDPSTQRITFPNRGHLDIVFTPELTTN